MPPGHLMYIERHKTGQDPCCACNVCMTGASEDRLRYICR